MLHVENLKKQYVSFEGKPGGGVLGVTMAAALVDGFIALNPAGIPRLDAIHVDAPVMLFAASLSAATTMAVGLLPAFQSADVVAALKLGGPGTAGGRQARMRRVLVVAEVALAFRPCFSRYPLTAIPRSSP